MTAYDLKADRQAFANNLGNWVNAMNSWHGMPATTPAVLMADLNSYAKRQPNGAQKILTNLGWQDAWNAPSKTNIQYSSINYNPLLADGSGFPAKPYVFKKSRRNPLGQATRIDYIMTLGPGVKAVDYKLVIYVNGNGTFAFDQVRVPKANLLNAFGDIDDEGQYVSPIDSENRRYSALALLLRAKYLVDVDCWTEVRSRPIKPGVVRAALSAALEKPS